MKYSLSGIIVNDIEIKIFLRRLTFSSLFIGHLYFRCVHSKNTSFSSNLKHNNVVVEVDVLVVVAAVVVDVGKEVETEALPWKKG